MGTRERAAALLAELPPGVSLVAAAKKRNAAEISAAIDGGVRIIGENYLQEALAVHTTVGRRARWHFIGRIQKNKLAKIVSIFDMIETVDSLETAIEINRRAAAAGRAMPVLFEINIAREPGKAGIAPEEAAGVVSEASGLPALRIKGLMTMGPQVGNPEQARPWFRALRRLAGEIASLRIPGTDMGQLSMGMSDSWRVAVEEGATMVRVGTLIFGPRP